MEYGWHDAVMWNWGNLCHQGLCMAGYEDPTMKNLCSQNEVFQAPRPITDYQLSGTSADWAAKVRSSHVVSSSPDAWVSGTKPTGIWSPDLWGDHYNAMSQQPLKDDDTKRAWSAGAKWEYSRLFH